MTTENPRNQLDLRLDRLDAMHGLGAVDEAPDIYRCGNKLVVRIGTPLPSICVKTNQPADCTLRRKLSWHPPAVFLALLLGLVPYVIIAVCVSRKATLDVPISAATRSKRRTWIGIGLVTLFAGIALIFFGISISSNSTRSGDTTGGYMALVGGILLFLDLFLAVYVSNMIVQPTRIDHEFVWLKGVSKDYLDGLPEF